MTTRVFTFKYQARPLGSAPSVPYKPTLIKAVGTTRALAQQRADVFVCTHYDHARQQ